MTENLPPHLDIVNDPEENLETRSDQIAFYAREVQGVMGVPPPRLLTGSYAVTLVILVVLIVGSAFIYLPNTISLPAILEQCTSSVSIYAPKHFVKIHDIYVTDREDILAGSPILRYIDSCGEDSLINSPIKGKIIYLRPLKPQENLLPLEALLTLTPSTSQLQGVFYLPAHQLMDIRIGQTILVNLNEAGNQGQTLTSSIEQIVWNQETQKYLGYFRMNLSTPLPEVEVYQATAQIVISHQSVLNKLLPF